MAALLPTFGAALFWAPGWAKSAERTRGSGVLPLAGERSTLRPFGVWFGRRTVYLPKLLRPDAAALLTLLWGVWTRKESPPAPPAPGLTSFAIDKNCDAAALHPAGFAVIGGRAIRFDMLERLEDELEQALSAGTDAETVSTKLVSLLGSSKEEASQVLAALGWRMVAVADAKPVWRRSKEKTRRREEPRKSEPPPDPNSPFAGLAALRIR
jgi:ATP-dependent RNA helicase SUPV3L1/SUV3